jgi:hypothetical protein
VRRRTGLPIVPIAWIVPVLIVAQAATIGRTFFGSGEPHATSDTGVGSRSAAMSVPPT